MGYRLDEVCTPGGLSWLDISDIIEHSKEAKGSAIRRAILNNDEIYMWEQGMSVQSMLADMIDVFVSANSKRKQKPYPRPWDKKNEKHFGKKPVSIAKLKELFGRGQ